MNPSQIPFNPILIETEMTVSGSARNKYASAGASLMDYFAAHAPEVPEWFSIKTDDGVTLTDVDRFFYWRWYYAETMMKGRPQ
jgi:hypothetical protein